MFLLLTINYRQRLRQFIGVFHHVDFNFFPINCSFEKPRPKVSRDKQISFVTRAAQDYEQQVFNLDRAISLSSISWFCTLKNKTCTI
jgi:hypothetical protein